MGHPVLDVAGRTALVTGSSRGIGRALAQGLAEAGCDVVLHGRDAATAAGAAAELGARSVAFDVTDPEAVERGAAEVGPLDILVNNAGIQHREPLLDLAAADWQRVLDTNLTSAFLVSRAFARGMVERGSGKIVNVASLQAALARPGIAAYAAAKGGLKMLTQSMCAEWGPAGVQANAIAPGYFATDLTRALVDDERFSEWVRGRTPAGRWGQVDELVGVLLFLASPASDYVCGQMLYVDGGMSAVV
ncbi:MAG TPA: SDR family oxidoreductase [Solirubrobacteraceae bacterium]|nr:SDR family oxidoreductase [Solirubrobacteraceae bacterium]